MGLIYELKTKILFVGMEDEHDSGQSEYSWPPYRSVGKFDPFGDDPRLAIQHIKFCQLTQTLCVGGAGGQVITFSLNTTQSDVKLEVCLPYIKACAYIKVKHVHYNIELKLTSELLGYLLSYNILLSI